MWLSTLVVCAWSATSLEASVRTPLEDRDGEAFGQGILWMAPFLSGGGYCSEATAFVKSLDAVPNLPLQIDQHGDSFSQPYREGLDKNTIKMLERLAHSRLPVNNQDAVVICHSEPGAWHPAMYSTSECPPRGAYGVGTGLVIGRTMFETDRLPKGWAARCNRMDAIWVPTRFALEVFRQGGVDEHRLFVVPEPVDVDFWDPSRASNLPEFSFPPEERQTKPQTEETRPFRFLSIFKWEERKGWRFLVEAFLSEFDVSQDNVVVYVLTNAYHSTDDFRLQIESLVRDLVKDGRVDSIQAEACLHKFVILPNNVPVEQMPALLYGVDAFVLPSRGEGWGRPHVEAMSMGLPVIATFWSGPTEFMTEENSYPLPIDGLEEITSGAFAGHFWARPSVSELGSLMRRVFSHPEEARAKGSQARKDMASKYCLDCVASQVLDTLSKVVRV
eukprot:gb/GEZN01007258.1/.p1 GENE.gb/GEZN01007258.1/~~gb/GEZN01007258.1/.p1  ORF type:complete len:445 (+),score=39.17 gb/GEZN01007258.1/:151-1485(+)